MRTRRAFLLPLIACLLAPAIGMQEDLADASFPGGNGLIAFTAGSFDPESVDDPAGDLEIATTRDDGSAKRYLTENDVDDYQPRFSANGKWLVFVRGPRRPPGQPRHDDIYVMRSDGGSVRQLTGTAAASEREPTFSPDMRWIVFVRERDLFRVSFDGSVLQRLTTTRVEERRPEVSPDGRLIVFNRSLTGGARNRIVVMRLGDRQTRMLVRGADQPIHDLSAINPVPGTQQFFPGGHHIAFLDFHTQRLFAISPNGGTPRMLSSPRGLDVDAFAISPDGAEVVVSSERGEMTVVSLRGKSFTSLRTRQESGGGYEPSWQPVLAR